MARTKDFDENAVLGKAIQLFWHKGYNGTSMQDLVDGLGISRSSLYDTYGDKHQLFLKALDCYKSANAGKFAGIVGRPAPAKEKIRELLEFVSDGLLNDKEHKGCFMVNAEVEVGPHDESVNQLICKNDQQVEDTFYLVIKQGQDEGEITRKQEAGALARFIFNTVKGMQVTAKSTTDPALFKDIIKIALAVLD